MKKQSWIFFFCLILFSCTPQEEVQEKKTSTSEESVQIEKVKGEKIDDREEDRKERDLLLGVLLDKIGDDQKEELFSLVEEKNVYRRKREKKEILFPGAEEEKIIAEIHALLDKWTQEEIGMLPKQSWGNHKEEGRRSVLEKMKGRVSSEDYQKMEVLFDKMKSLRSGGHLDAEKENKYIYEMEQIFLDYPNLDGRQFVMNLWANEKIIGIFDVKVSDPIYQKGTLTGLEEISEEKISEYTGYWRTVQEILPKKMTDRFSRFVIMSDGIYGTFAYVNVLDDNGKDWMLALDPEDLWDYREVAYTLIHEYAHVFSLDDTQVEYRWDGFAPRDLYWDDEVRAKKESYINQFHREKT